MPNLTTPIPPKLTENPKEDVKKLKEWGTALIDELTYIFAHLDAGNVSEAASVKAENIDTTAAKISNAQIGTLTADKLIAGTVNTNMVSVEDTDGLLSLSGSSLIISDRNHPRLLAAYDKQGGEFLFLLCNKLGIPTVSIDSSGNAVFCGQVESSKIFASSIIGTDSASYAEAEGGVFAQLDPTGIKIMHDENKERLQKLGMSVGDDGTAYMVLGAGNGENSHTINGVVYTNGSFKIEKNESYANLGLVGYAPQIHFWEDNGELWLSGSKVMVNNVNLNQEITKLNQTITTLTQRITALESRLAGLGQ